MLKILSSESPSTPIFIDWPTPKLCANEPVSAPMALAF